MVLVEWGYILLSKGINPEIGYSTHLCSYIMIMVQKLSLYYEEEFLTACDRLKSIVKVKDATWAKDYDVLIFEGSQGLLLDMDCGFYPNVTPSRVGLNGIESQYLKDAEVYLVTRTYTTRHGNGYEPKYKLDIDLSGKHETNIKVSSRLEL